MWNMPSAQRKCVWCGGTEHVREAKFVKSDSRTVPFDFADCEKKTKEFLTMDALYARPFYMMEMVLIAVTLTLLFARLEVYAFLILGGVGILMVPFPFMAAPMAGALGLKKSILVARLIGMAIAVAGLAFAIY